MIFNSSPGRIDATLSLQTPGAAKVQISPAAPRPSRDLDRVWSLPGLCWNAPVMTSFGTLPVQVLRKHDPLRMSDGQILRIEWIDKVQIDEDFLNAYPDAQPILIRAGALGLGLPKQDLLVSPGQKIALSNMGRSDLRTARDLLGRPGILRKPETMVTYYLFHCGKPANIQSDGLGLLTEP